MISAKADVEPGTFDEVKESESLWVILINKGFKGRRSNKLSAMFTIEALDKRRIKR